MPRYEYECPVCDKEMEVAHAIDVPHPPLCPHCLSKGGGVKVYLRKVFRTLPAMYLKSGATRPMV